MLTRLFSYEAGWIIDNGYIYKSNLDDHFGFVRDTAREHSLINIPWVKEDNDKHLVNDYMDLAFNKGWIRIASYPNKQYIVTFTNKSTRLALKTMFNLIDEVVLKDIVYVDYFLIKDNVVNLKPENTYLIESFKDLLKFKKDFKND